MLEFINENPGIAAILSIFIGLVTLGGVQWKVLSVLFIKPRDEELTRLQRQIDEISQRAYDSGSSPEKVFTRSAPDANTSTSSQGEGGKSNLFSSLLSFRETTKRTDITELQRQALMKEVVGAVVTWDGEVFSVDERDGGINVAITAGEDGLAIAFCQFDSSFRPRLAKLMRGHHITVKGTIDGTEIGVFLRDCELVWSEADD